jgi:hypothetical protein
MSSVLSVPFHVSKILFGILVTAMGNPAREHHARRVFRQTLRRSGLTSSEVEELAAEYRPGLGLRDLVRAARSRVT